MDMFLLIGMILRKIYLIVDDYKEYFLLVFYNEGNGDYGVWCC